MKTWLHRISYSLDASYPLLERGWLSIGFSDLATMDFIPNLIEKGMDFMDSRMDEAYGGPWKAKWSLWYFITGMKKGDRVVVPKGGTFSVYEIIDDLPLPLEDEQVKNVIKAICAASKGGLSYMEPDRVLRPDNTDADLGFFRRVEPVSAKSLNISRYDYCDAALASRMKIRVTTAEITDIALSVDNTLHAFAQKCPLKLFSQVGPQITDLLLGTIKAQLNPDKFELLIKWYFTRLGATVVTIPAKNESGKEGDADIIATFEPLRTIFYIQAKFQQGQISEWGAKQVLDYVNNVRSNMAKKALRGDSIIQDNYIRNSWLVSTCDSFSSECISIAQENDLLLISGKDFADMLIKAGLAGIDSIV
jgi:hypothetical protein